MTSKQEVKDKILKGEIGGNLRGNLECGSAQPSLFFQDNFGS
jgi:hypothetical protein